MQEKTRRLVLVGAALALLAVAAIGYAAAQDNATHGAALHGGAAHHCPLDHPDASSGATTPPGSPTAA